MASMMHQCAAGRERPGALLPPKLVFSTSVETAHVASSGSPWREDQHGCRENGSHMPSSRSDRHATTRSLAAGGNRSHGPAFLPPERHAGAEQGSGRWQISGTWTWPDRLSDPTDSTVVKELLDRSRSETHQ